MHVLMIIGIVLMSLCLISYCTRRFMPTFALKLFVDLFILSFIRKHEDDDNAPMRADIVETVCHRFTKLPFSVSDRLRLLEKRNAIETVAGTDYILTYEGEILQEEITKRLKSFKHFTNIKVLFLDERL